MYNSLTPSSYNLNTLAPTRTSITVENQFKIALENNYFRQLQKNVISKITSFIEREETVLAFLTAYDKEPNFDDVLVIFDIKYKFRPNTLWPRLTLSPAFTANAIRDLTICLGKAISFIPEIELRDMMDLKCISPIKRLDPSVHLIINFTRDNINQRQISDGRELWFCQVLRQSLYSRISHLIMSDTLLSLSDIICLSNFMRSSDNVVQDLVLVACHITDEKIIALAPSLIGINSLAKLTLNNNTIGDDGLIALLDMLPQSVIRTFNIASNVFGDKGIRKLLITLPKTKVKSLNLSFSKISPIAANMLSRFLGQSPCLSDLFYYGNKVNEDVKQRFHSLEINVYF